MSVLEHGQRVGFAGDAERVVETARNGITRIGTHSRFGFGELRVRPPQAVPQYARRDDESRAARDAEPVASDTAREAQEDEDADEDRDVDEPQGRVLVGAGGDAATGSGGDRS